jgi:hypothetical protein
VRPNDLREARDLEGLMGSISKVGGVGFMLLGLCGILLHWSPFTAKPGEDLKPDLLMLGLVSLLNAGIFLGRLRATAVSVTKEQFQDFLHRKVTEQAINRLVLITGGVFLTFGVGMITLGLH